MKVYTGSAGSGENWWLATVNTIMKLIFLERRATYYSEQDLLRSLNLFRVIN